MGIDYTFYLRIGFELDIDIVSKPYEIFHEEKSHYEDRFDPKTGKKLKPEKIIDEHGGEYFSLEYNSEEYKSFWDVINETDYFHKKLGCEISTGFNSDVVSFYLEQPKSETIGCGRVRLYDTEVPISWIEQNKKRLLELKNKLEKEFSIDAGEPKIFIESWIG